MSNGIRVVAPVPPEVTALTETCKRFATDASLERFELAVKGRTEIGIRDDNDLRIVDEINHQCVLAKDSIDQADPKNCDAAIKSPISAAHALHKALLGVVKPYVTRWSALIEKTDKMILGYKAKQRELAERQQRELDRAQEEQRKRLEAEARAKLRAGDIEAARAAMEEARTVVALIISMGTPILDNTNDRSQWQAEITDAEAVVKAIAAGTIPISVIKEWDITFLKRKATERGGLNWPGVRTWQENKLTHTR